MTLCDKCGKEAAGQGWGIYRWKQTIDKGRPTYVAALCDSCAKPIIELLGAKK